MRTGFVIVTYQTEKKEIERLKNEINQLGFTNFRIYIIDNTKNNLGYAAGVNKGLKKAFQKNCDLLIIGNPDISFCQITKKDILKVAEKFSIAGFAFRQNGKTYYGGEIDRWRMSGGLISTLPANRYQEVDYVSGSLLIVRRQVFNKTGLMPEDYFLYYEDVDFSYRADQFGFKIGIDSQMMYEHRETSGQLNLAKKDLLFKNRFRFFWKYASLRKKIRELIRLPKTLWEERDFFKRFFLNSNFLVNYLGINLTSLLTKLLNFLWFLVMMKYFNPQEYGIYTLVWAQINLISPLIDLGTTSYGIVYGNKEKDLESVLSLRYFLGAVVFILTLIGGWLFNNNLFIFIALTSTVVFSNMASGGYLVTKALKNKAYHSSIVGFIFNALLISCLIFGLIKTHSLQAVFIIISFNYALQAALYLFLIKNEFGKVKFQWAFKQWKKIVSKSYQFVLINLLSQIYFKVDVFLLSALKSNAEVGIYSAGFKFFQTLIFFGSSYTLTSTPKLSRLADTNLPAFITKIKKDLLFLTIFGLTLAIGFYLLSPFVLNILMKKTFSPSLTVARITVFALPLILLSSAFLNVLYVLKKANMAIYLFTFQLILNFILNLIFIPIYSFYASAWITVMSEMINLAVLVVITRKILLEKKYGQTN